MLLSGARPAFIYSPKVEGMEFRLARGGKNRLDARKMVRHRYPPYLRGQLALLIAERLSIISLIIFSSQFYFVTVDRTGNIKMRKKEGSVIHTIKSDSDLAKLSVLVANVDPGTGCRLWNDLPATVRAIDGRDLFEAEVRRLLLV
ncbi:uncharacterized protein LOC120352763 isoform X2 [Nilaparvata lugens]|uniref:uncharacterized protein LOC120352763 isoform X2 n=1 Tax=Nilaparvata lugens TaxID=108931 RepID=UPI00193DB2DC|nr:uncharacterized protein LOC120352763 isoform X2 [Nilaparvata lugens]